MKPIDKAGVAARRRKLARQIWTDAPHLEPIDKPMVDEYVRVRIFYEDLETAVEAHMIAKGDFEPNAPNKKTLAQMRRVIARWERELILPRKSRMPRAAFRIFH